MRNTKRSVARLLCVVLVVILTVGCGGGLRVINQCDRCGEQLKQLYEILRNYAKDHDRFPSDRNGGINWKEVLETVDVEHCPHCPNAKDTEFGYIIFHPDLYELIRNDVDDEIVVIGCDLPGNHPIPGMDGDEFIQLLYSNGNVERSVITEKEIEKWESSAEEGKLLPADIIRLFSERSVD